MVSSMVVVAAVTMFSAQAVIAQAPFPVPGTAQEKCYSDTRKSKCPKPGQTFFGQDAQQGGVQPSYRDNLDGTITDTVTGLMWMKSPDLNGDGKIDAQDKLTYEQAMSFAKTHSFAGHSDWRIPTIKEMYSLIDFRGIDPSGYKGNASGLTPFINTTYFDFGYGDEASGERIIDAQMASSTLYVSGTGPRNDRTMFGVNFADGRIKGYGLRLRGAEKTFYVMMVRGNTGYGVNDLADNRDGTVSDATTGLMWTQEDSAQALSWKDALAWAEQVNQDSYLGYDDWRLPNVKELQSIVDYTRAPERSKSGAIDPVFQVSTIRNEAGQVDYPAYWSATTHENMSKRSGRYASYVNFGRAMGYMRDTWVDAHGAGAQRSDPKTGSATDYPQGHGPQGDAIRVLNHARLVRSAE